MQFADLKEDIFDMQKVWRRALTIRKVGNKTKRERMTTMKGADALGV